MNISLKYHIPAREIDFLNVNLTKDNKAKDNWTKDNRFVVLDEKSRRHKWFNERKHYKSNRKTKRRNAK